MHNSPNLNRTEQLLNAAVGSTPVVTAVPVTDTPVTAETATAASNDANSDTTSSSSNRAHRNNWRSVSAATQERMQQEQHKPKHPHDMIERRIVSRLIVGD